MQIKGSKILVLGGWGLVGSAICHKLMQQAPAKITVTSLRKSEAEDAVNQLRKSYPNVDPNMFEAKWGNIFTSLDYKDKNWGDVLAKSESRKEIIGDIFDELDKSMLEKSTLFRFIADAKPDLVIDCINTATGIAYQDVYTTTNTVKRSIAGGKMDEEEVERMMASMYVPQLIRHVQILYYALLEAKTTMYFKIGTSGTGGMGLNIPYTHSEERPSRVLLAKTAVAGAQTLLLFLMARTPGGAKIKEIKPTATIAWKRIAYDKVMRKGQAIPLVDMSVESAHEVGSSFKFSDNSGVKDTDGFFKSVFIDTGENGIFSKAEFETISSFGQMEMITPEEIAEYLVFEVLGGNTGKDVLAGLDAVTMGASYRAGFLRESAMKKLNALEKENDNDSVAFELLGPPRLSKLLFEAYILRKLYGSINNVLKQNPEDISKAALDYIKKTDELRSEMLSIGLVILLPDGKKYLRGKDVKIPVKAGNDEIELTPEMLEKWTYDAWVDLRANNFKAWQDRFQRIIKQTADIDTNDTSSRYIYNNDYWNNFESVEEGKIVGWVFENEDDGWRFKH